MNDNQCENCQSFDTEVVQSFKNAGKFGDVDLDIWECNKCGKEWGE